MSRSFRNKSVVVSWSSWRNYTSKIFQSILGCLWHFDGPDAPAIRRSNLGLVLEAALAGGISSLWIARDLGHRGGRRTGLALTDEVHLPAHAACMAPCHWPEQREVR